MTKPINWEEKNEIGKKKLGISKETIISEKEVLQRLYSNYYSIQRIASLYKIAHTSLRPRMKKLDIKILSYKQQLNKGLKTKQHF